MSVLGLNAAAVIWTLCEACVCEQPIEWVCLLPSSHSSLCAFSDCRKFRQLLRFLLIFCANQESGWFWILLGAWILVSGYEMLFCCCSILSSNSFTQIAVLAPMEPGLVILAIVTDEYTEQHLIFSFCHNGPRVPAARILPKQCHRKRLLK